MISLSTNSRDFGDETNGRPARTKLGAVNIYAPNEATLASELGIMSKAIDLHSHGHLLIARNVLSKLVRVELSLPTLDRRLFGAVLGMRLRLGFLDAVVCSSVNEKNYRVYLHKDNVDKVEAAIIVARSLLRSQQSVAVSDLESKIFGERRYNTFSASSHILAHLAFIGEAELIDRFSARMTPGLFDACRRTIE